MVLNESTEDVKKKYFSNWNIVPYSTFYIHNKFFVGQKFAYILCRTKKIWLRCLDFYACNLVIAFKISSHLPEIHEC